MFLLEENRGETSFIAHGFEDKPVSLLILTVLIHLQKVQLHLFKAFSCPALKLLSVSTARSGCRNCSALPWKCSRGCVEHGLRCKAFKGWMPCVANVVETRELRGEWVCPHYLGNACKKRSN